MNDHPSYVKVLGQTFTLEWVRKSDELSERQRVGRTDIQKQAISVDATAGDDQQRDVVLHEIIHACLRVVASGVSETTEERVTSLLAPLLLDVLRANPHVVQFLLAGA